MQQIEVKLFAHLTQFMPQAGVKGAAPYDCANDSTVNSVLRELHVPLEHCHLVLVNGLFIHPEQRDIHSLAKGDTLAVWPPIAGG